MELRLRELLKNLEKKTILDKAKNDKGPIPNREFHILRFCNFDNIDFIL